jgi:Photosynthetic reaction centre cytochrome C subunit
MNNILRRWTFMASLVLTSMCATAAMSIWAIGTHSDKSVPRTSKPASAKVQHGASESDSPDLTAIKQFNAQQAGAILKQIAGKEDQPAGDVFKNVKFLKAVPAARLLKIMELGYATSLGVKCTHCHVTDDWANDAMPEKQIARDMISMVQTINNSLLKNINNLKGPDPIVNCTTCHRGQVKPALNMPNKESK